MFIAREFRAHVLPRYYWTHMFHVYALRYGIFLSLSCNIRCRAHPRSQLRDRTYTVINCKLVQTAYSKLLLRIAFCDTMTLSAVVDLWFPDRMRTKNTLCYLRGHTCGACVRYSFISHNTANEALNTRAAIKSDIG